MYKNYWKPAIILALCTMLLACSRQDAQAEKHLDNPLSVHLAGKLTLTGSSTMAPLMQAIGERFRALHPNVQIRVLTGGSSRGINDARAGKADIGMASQALTDRESDLDGFLMARDGVGIIVNKDNPLTTLTDRQVADIFTGRIGNWKALSGRDAPIVVINRERGHSEVELFTRYFKFAYGDIRAAITIGDNQPTIDAVAGNPDAITFVSLGEAERMSQTGMNIKLLALNGVAASSKTVRNGNYPLSRPLSLVTKDLPKGLARAFIAFSLSPQVTDLIEENNFVPYED
ncbi:ABC transporter substrate-binding protein [Sulfuriferula sp. AH1]|uniref:phosphate ABC transporter substrate-binding protein n=1 Tax=Sulfuriferula sp. AH1 TaxID=1985873 RepID=UPI000B558E1C|nr:phosphate ABC transporter substrate-binding protein [Sulfuriferula sp. AH1]ARU32851.1 ABC transporter substrate-binding protein [Sulfuriferula sp. AH1]